MSGLAHSPQQSFGEDAAATPARLLQVTGSLLARVAGAVQFAGQCRRELNRRGEISEAAFARISDRLARA